MCSPSNLSFPFPPLSSHSPFPDLHHSLSSVVIYCIPQCSTFSDSPCQNGHFHVSVLTDPLQRVSALLSITFEYPVLSIVRHSRVYWVRPRVEGCNLILKHIYAIYLLSELNSASQFLHLQNRNVTYLLGFGDNSIS